MRAAAPRVLAALVLALTLGACGGNNPKPSPVVESSPAASATPSSSAPTMPAEAKGTDAEAAKAFIRHFMDLFTYAARTGDVESLRAASDPSCESCSQVIESIARAYADGGYAKGDGYAVNDLVVRSSSPDSVVLAGMVTLYEQEFKANASASPTTSPESVVKSVFTLTRATDTWVVRTWERP